jgi:AraC-like DNA-binding protein
MVAVARGSAWIIPESGTPVLLGPGDVAIARGPDAYVLADQPTTPPDIVIHPGQRCESLTGESMQESMALGLRTWGNDPAGGTVVLIGTYESMGDISDRLLRALPPVLSLKSDEWDCPLLPWLCDEVARNQPGQAVVVDRMLDLMVIAVLRAWLVRPEAAAPAWYQAQSDPIVGQSLRIMQNNPAEPWTVASLAAQLGVSRAAFARRFNDLVGEPPMTFLTSWRLDLAADLLHQPDATIGAVARAVGYGSPFALSAAFKRVRGVSPREHRARAFSA